VNCVPPRGSHFGAHIGQAFQADEIVGVAAVRTWISIDPNVDYDKTLAASKEGGRTAIRLYRGAETYLDERIRTSCRGSEPIVVPYLRFRSGGLLARPGGSRAAGPRQIKGIDEVKKDIMSMCPTYRFTENLLSAAATAESRRCDAARRPF